MRPLAFAAAALVTACGASAAPPHPIRLDNPAQVLVLDKRSLLVAERGTRNRILRVDRKTGAFTVFARGIREPWGLARDVDGSVVVSSTSGLYRIGPTDRPTRIANVSVTPFALLPGGDIAFAYGTSVGVIAHGSRAPRTLFAGVDAPHGLVVLSDGALAVSDTGHDRILRIDPGSGASTVITDKLDTPLGIALEPSGALLVAEFGRARLVRVDPTGAMMPVATRLGRPYTLARAGDGTVYVTDVGEVTRATGRLLRIAPNGSVAAVQLRARRAFG